MARAPARCWSRTACKMSHYFSGVVLVFLMVFLQPVELCLPRSIQASVPSDVMVGYVISRVNLDRCGGLTLTSDDPRFLLQRDGSIVTRQAIRIPPPGRKFTVWFQDQNGRSRKMHIGLSQRAREVGLREHRSGAHRRYKRRWSPLPFLIVENDIPPFPKELDLIGSDTSQNYSLYYEISGPGVTEHPQGVFSVNRLTGMLSVHKPVDREQFPVFQFTARAIDRLTHRDTDVPLTVTVNVMDVNDNKPQFSGPMQFTVLEKSPPGTVVGMVSSTDADEENTDHTKVRYSLLSGADMFIINPSTGVITTRTGTLDREVKSTHLVVVQLKDMDGGHTGLASTGTATISLNDINDNPPTFKSKVYNAHVKENEDSGLILRIPVEDKDLEKTPNWKAVYKIVKGNEDGSFKIETDPATNEGLLHITKPLNYEKTKKLTLQVMAENEVPLVGTSDTWATAQVDVSVEDVDEGPEFVPPILLRWVKENTPNDTVIGTYTATDPETSSSAGIRYTKVSDPAGWLKVEEHTGELKIANTVDRESEFVQDGMYNVTIKAVDASSKSSTGTVVIYVQDENDNIPTPMHRELILCEKKGQVGSVLVEAEDKDQKPFSDPFTFQLVDGHDGKWKLERVDGKSALLQPVKELPTGKYEVPIMIKDQQSLGELQTVTVRICQCRNGKCPSPLKSSALGVWGILALLFGLALLLALCCAMSCSKKGEEFHVLDGTDGGGMLLTSNTEAPGDAVTSDIVLIPGPAIDHSTKGSYMEDSHVGMANVNTFKGAAPFNPQPSIYQPSEEVLMTENHEAFSRGMYGTAGSSSHLVDGHALKFMDPSALSTWNTNGMFIHQKLDFFRTQEDGRYADDLLHTYGFEGVGSAAGSVGCCSEQGDEDGLEFLNTLGPKFKNLAEVCSKK